MGLCLPRCRPWSNLSSKPCWARRLQRPARPLAGGDTSTALRLDTARGPFVVKLRRESGHPAQFFAEAQGLGLLRGAGVRVPEVLGYGLAPAGPAAQDWAYLLLSYLLPVPETPQAQGALGQTLAALHRVSAASFGGTPDNFMGALPQTNPASASAAEFFWDARLTPQLRLATHLGEVERRGFEALRERLPRLICHSRGQGRPASPATGLGAAES